MAVRFPIIVEHVLANLDYICGIQGIHMNVVRCQQGIGPCLDDFCYFPAFIIIDRILKLLEIKIIIICIYYTHVCKLHEQTELRLHFDLSKRQIPCFLK